MIGHTLSGMEARLSIDENWIRTEMPLDLNLDPPCAGNLYYKELEFVIKIIVSSELRQSVWLVQTSIFLYGSYPTSPLHKSYCYLKELD